MRFYTNSCLITLTIIFISCGTISDKTTKSPNILFISIDDLNDWTSLKGGHPQIKTPNLDKLSYRGVYFSKAYCAAPACNPSRVAIMTGISPTTSGIYYNEQDLRVTYPDAVTIPQYFRRHGYTSLGSGKIFHRLFADPSSWDEYAPAVDQQTFDEPEFPKNVNGLNMSHFDWGPIKGSDEEMADAKTVKWVSNQLSGKFDRPFFMACGFYRPHLPWYVPKKYFDMHPLNQIQLPETIADDLDDLPAGAKTLIRFNDHQQVTSKKQWKAAVQGYLASISFMDAQLGKLIDALDNSEYKENTIVVLWSDHGWNLGEKEHWRKFALWERTTRVPLLIIPIGAQGAKRVVCDKPVNLLDVYPTLIEMAGLPNYDDLSGHSLFGLIDDPSTEWSYPSITSYGQYNHAVRSDDFRFISYKDGTEELYDMSADPYEYNNLAQDPAFTEILNAHRKWLPIGAKDVVSFGEYESFRDTKPGL